MDLRSWCLYSLAVFLALLQSSSSELFTALVDLERVLYAEDDLAKTLREYIESEEQRLTALKRIAADYESHSQSALKDVAKHLSNPVNAFLLVKRFTSDWQQVENLIRNNSAETFMAKVSNTMTNFPDEEDLVGAANALLRLQDTYALETDKLAKGQIKGVRYSPELSAEDCFELGRIAYTAGDYYHTVLWMQESKDIWEHEAEKTVDKATILDYLSFSLSMQGNTRAALNLTLEWLAIDPTHQRAQNNKVYYEQILADEEAERQKGDAGDLNQPDAKQANVVNSRQLDGYRGSEEFQTYEALCRGEDIIDYPLAHKLTCQYRHFHPYFILRPLKEEVAYLDPFIATYHDLLTDTEIVKIKELAFPRLKRATVQNPQTGQLETAFYRVSKSAWLRDEEDPLIRRASQKARIVANLTLDTAEELQVVNYGIGGHYEPHYDFARKREVESFENWRGNRIATALFYMSDVEAGGATVFTQLGVKLWPTKGSLALWYNLERSGEGAYRTRHAGCPVLTGSKWVSNKWFHERGQEFIRPCSLNPEE